MTTVPPPRRDKQKAPMTTISSPCHDKQKAPMTTIPLPRHDKQKAPMTTIPSPRHDKQKAPMTTIPSPHDYKQKAPMTTIPSPHDYKQKAPMTTIPSPHDYKQKAPMTTIPSPHDYKQKAPMVSEETPEDKKLQTYCRGNYPPGFHFMPSDAELILEYLKKKIQNLPIPIAEICEVNLYRHNPQDLAARYPQLGEMVWYFFTPRDRKYRNGTRPNRAAGAGYWKATGADKKVFREGKEVGSRKALVFYEGRPPKGQKTDWIMHEYRLADQPPRNKRDANDMRLDDWVLCRIHEKIAKPEKKNVQQPRNNQQDDQPLMNPRPERSVDNIDNLGALTIHDNVATPDPQFVDNHGNLAAALVPGDNAVQVDPSDQSLDDWIQSALSDVDDHCVGNFGFQCNDDPQTSFGYGVPDPFGVLYDPFQTRFLHEEEHQWGFHDHQWWGGSFDQQVPAPYYGPSTSNGGGFITDSFIKSEGPSFDDAMMINNVPDDHYQTVPRKTRRMV
ncbi:UNVERIFIED_CONTAM: NAC domain-containing protein 18 [Sesamum latifolium]|uniref:NAC domain-containing protein 18 n=1 Tax=Sesamum latifolium TaxID=2727402 RepID=A0AAW2Y5M3_9LAMI